MKSSGEASRASRAARSLLLVPFVLLGFACGGGNQGGDTGGGDASHDGDVIGTLDTGSLDSDVAPNDTNPFDAPPSEGGVIVSDSGMTVHDPDGGAWTCYQITCRQHLLDCGDCMDNDGDGLIDQHDPDCLGPCGNSEGPTLYPDVGGGTAAACTINCYFDYGIGRGTGCVWSHHCDPHEVPPNFWPQANCDYRVADIGGTTCPATQNAECLSTCAPLTPNGCDCFGCCTFPEIATRPDSAGGAWVYLGSMDGANTPTCSFADVTNVNRCHPCQPVVGCLNNCGPCEVCIGRPAPDPSCFSTPDAGPVSDAATDSGIPTDGGGTTMQCATGVQPCGLLGQAECPFGWYCITGCCQQAPP